MTRDLADSYAWCRQVCRDSKSSFYSSFALLDPPRRNAMYALYAFSRISDDLSDGSRPLEWRKASLELWRQSVLRLETQLPEESHNLSVYAPLWPALHDSMHRFDVPFKLLEDIVNGVMMDLAATQPEGWSELKVYCYHVASAVGLACTYVWRQADQIPQQSAIDCGIAFQLTNILRDVSEDAMSQRIYLPKDLFARYGVSADDWLAGRPSGNWKPMIQEVAEEATQLYNSGWQTIHALTPRSRRMFSLIWRSYRSLLDDVIDQQDVFVAAKKSAVVDDAQSSFIIDAFPAPFVRGAPRTEFQVFVSDQHAVPDGSLTHADVVVIGGGLAGIAAALALAKAGKAVTLLESKRRLGGRSGSFSASDELGREEVVDYCQHVGMGCCYGLRQLISWLGQSELWEEHRQLHFFGPSGEYRRLAALPFVPAPLHLAGWLIKWPGLRLVDRCAVAHGMWRIRGLKLVDELDEVSALQWLRENRQTRAAIERFWSTIIVSALGEQLERVSLAAVCKVLQDGFLNDREAFHLLVPKLPLGKLFNEMAFHALREQNVDVRLSAPVKSVCKREVGVSIQCGEDYLEADSVICAVPWHQVSRISWQQAGESAQEMQALGRGLQSSSITGVHTWWNTNWLPTPHAAVVGRLCQWVFPKQDCDSFGEFRSANFQSASAVNDVRGYSEEHYFQIVISGSRDLSGIRQEDLGRMVQEDLARVFPRVKQATLIRFKVVTDPMAVFSVLPGALRFRPPAKSAMDGVWLAGDWTRTGWPSTMEGAILSGFEAAQSVLASHTNARA